MNNKVYINPKFNRMSPTNLALLTKNKMHVNPNFSSLMMQNNSKIYVNPRFITPNVNCTLAQNEIRNNRISESSKADFSPKTTKKSENMLQNTTSKSRYSLVRHTATQVLPKQTYVKTTTMKINKYKSVTISDFKKKFDVKVSLNETDKSAPLRGQQVILRSNKKLPSPTLKQTPQYLGSQNSSKNNNKSRFKLFNIPPKSIRSVSISSPLKSKTKINLKKNNIPCPLYKKYGKCLRIIHGSCEYVHDKKHISICRKFMKGICHDNSCLLSHEITSKKMPTCYFYLKGMCVKENCPYLHIKLNEKTKVCSEFLKGYCEKGDKCLNRHVDIYRATEKKKGVKQHIMCSSKNRTKQTKVNKYKLTVSKDLIKIAQITPVNDDAKPNISGYSDIRYYKEQQTGANVEESSEVIKPTRCKLGTLPSFIKL